MVSYDSFYQTAAEISVIALVLLGIERHYYATVGRWISIYSILTVLFVVVYSLGVLAGIFRDYEGVRAFVFGVVAGQVFGVVAVAIVELRRPRE